MLKMRVEIHLEKSVEENASVYYEEAKKIRQKIEGASQTLETTKKKIKTLEKQKPEPKKEQKEARKKHWFEKFRWFNSSEGFLVICGRDATSNELIVKKHMDINDIVLHTEAPGSPFCIIKAGNKVPTEKTINEAAVETASYSKAWKLGVSYTEVFHVKPEQVSKQAESGEYLQKGSFMIRGKKNIIKTKLEIAIGNKDDQIISGPVDAIKSQTDKYVTIIQGREKASDLAKTIKKKIGGDLDEILFFIPAGGGKIK